MNTIKFNGVNEWEVENYSKNTYFNGTGATATPNGSLITSTANCTIKVADISVLNALAEDTITSIQIYHDEELIYNLQNISAKIDSINEYLAGDHMNINVYINFNAGDTNENNI